MLSNGLTTVMALGASRKLNNINTMEYIWVNHNNLDYNSMPYRKSYRAWAGGHEYPVDRFDVSEGRLEMPHKNIVRDPVYNLNNLSKDWQDRYFSTIDAVANSVYNTAGSRTINLLFSGGVDSTAVYVALAKHPKFKEFVEAGRFIISLTSISIQEYPELFYREILPNIPIQPLDYNKSMLDNNMLVVNGDLGDFIIGNSDAFGFDDINLMDHYSEITKIIQQKELWEYNELCSCALKKSPFEITSVNQFLWWINQAYVCQIDLVRPYIWSSTNDYTDIGNNNKVFRFFYDDRITTYSYEYMSTNPICNTYDSLRTFPKNYIVNYTHDQSYMTKSKVHSQRLTLRFVYKSEIFVSQGQIYDRSTSEKKVWQPIN